MVRPGHAQLNVSKANSRLVSVKDKDLRCSINIKKVFKKQAVVMFLNTTGRYSNIAQRHTTCI